MQIGRKPRQRRLRAGRRVQFEHGRSREARQVRQHQHAIGVCLGTGGGEQRKRRGEDQRLAVAAREGSNGESARRPAATAPRIPAFERTRARPRATNHRDADDDAGGPGDPGARPRTADPGAGAAPVRRAGRGRQPGSVPRAGAELAGLPRRVGAGDLGAPHRRAHAGAVRRTPAPPAGARTDRQRAAAVARRDGRRCLRRRAVHGAGRERRARVHAALQALSPPLRDVLVLRVVERLDYAAIADALAVPLGTVKSRVAAATLRLAERLQDLGGDP